jgi:hypothetical protein
MLTCCFQLSSSDKAKLGIDFASPEVTASMSESTHTIEVIVLCGTALTALDLYNQRVANI